MAKRTIYVRVDGDSEIGLGHIFRCIALCEMLQREFDCRFIVKNPLAVIEQNILHVATQLIPLNEPKDTNEAQFLIREYLTAGDIVILDGYHFDSDYQLELKKVGCHVVCIDDIHAFHFYADVIINHSPSIHKSQYSTEPYTQFCLGLDYALLRKPFLDVASGVKTYRSDRDQNVFICLGGADPQNHILQVLDQFEGADFQQCFVVVGSAYRFETELQSFINESELDIQVLKNLEASEMLKLMQQCGVAITSPSTVAVEYLSVGGKLFLFKIADNQNDIFTFLIEHNIAQEFSLSEKINSTVTGRTPALIDGNQQKRLMRLFKSLTLEVREAKPEDKTMYFNWVNDSAVRSNSYHSAPIPWDSHVNWFLEKLHSPSSKLYIVSDEQDPIGQIRFELNDGFAVLSFSLDSAYRGRGLSEPLLRRGISVFKGDLEKQIDILAFVKKENIKSAHTFRSIGAVEKEAEEYPNSFKYIL